MTLQYYSLVGPGMMFIAWQARVYGWLTDSLLAVNMQKSNFLSTSGGSP